MKKSARRKSSLGAWLADAASPLFLLNPKCKVLYFNRGCENLTGWQADAIVGKVCHYGSEPDANSEDAITSAICPPAEVLAGSNHSIPTYFIHRNGKTTTQMVHFFPLLDDEGNVESVLGLISPLQKPVQAGELNATHQLHAELASLRLQLRQKYGLNAFIGKSPAMQRVMSQIQLAGPSQSSLLLTGEPGTGKEFIARLVHQLGRESQRAFVPLDCTKLVPRELLRTLRRMYENIAEGESTTLPVTRQPGTLYLSQIEMLPRDAQQYLLDIYQHAPAIRLMAGANCNLQQSLEEEALLPEFYYLITTMEISLPPLRTRADDYMFLAQHLLEQFNRGAEHQITGFDDTVWREFKIYNWPGNTSELHNVIREARAACTTSLIQRDDLPFRFQTGRDAQRIPPEADQTQPLESALQKYETELIKQALKQARNNKTLAAELLQISRPKLYHRMETLGIEED